MNLHWGAILRDQEQAEILVILRELRSDRLSPLTWTDVLSLAELGKL